MAQPIPMFTKNPHIPNLYWVNDGDDRVGAIHQRNNQWMVEVIDKMPTTIFDTLTEAKRYVRANLRRR